MPPGGRTSDLCTSLWRCIPIYTGINNIYWQRCPEGLGKKEKRRSVDFRVWESSRVNTYSPASRRSEVADQHLQLDYDLSKTNVCGHTSGDWRMDAWWSWSNVRNRTPIYRNTIVSNLTTARLCA